jgi:hypothetical protein
LQIIAARYTFVSKLHICLESKPLNKMINLQIEEYIRGRQLVTSFKVWCESEKRDKISRQTFYLAFKSDTPSLRQKQVIAYAAEFVQFHSGQTKPIEAAA